MWVMLKTRANMTDCVYWLESVGCSGKDLLLCDPGSYAAQWKMGCCCYAIPSDTMQYYMRIPYNTTEYQVKAHNTMQYQAIALNTLQYHVIWRNPGCCAAQSRTKCCSCRGGGQRLRQRWLHWEGRRAPTSPLDPLWQQQLTIAALSSKFPSTLEGPNSCSCCWVRVAVNCEKSAGSYQFMSWSVGR